MASPPLPPPPVLPAVRPEVHLLTFGCRAQQADEEVLRAALVARGLTVLEGKKVEGAGIAVVHGCVVTARAERDARKAIRRLRREHPDLRIVVSGCHARLSGDAASRELGADLALPELGPEELATAIRERLVPSGLLPACAPSAEGGRRRVALRIQDGCDNSCAYCIVPAVRGKSRSVPVATVLEDIGRLAERGAPEVVLSGIQTAAWGRDLDPPSTLCDLLEKILALPRRPRIRISSVEPQYLTPRLIELVVGERGICPHLHVPLQSASPRLLAAMGRADVAPAIELLERAWARHGDLAVGFDVIAGLPTETEPEHQVTVDLVERLPLAYLHVFTFSARPGTPAATMLPSVPERFAVLRTRALLRSDERLRAAYRARILARGRAEVAVEHMGEDGFGRGTTERFLPAAVISHAVKPGALVRGRTDGIGADGALRVVPE
ncbi:MAG: MiaB/RimO family radical SAM methylthiotransferase [Deltaproteobacteria bacterium]|nr:MiaB/RimO family radical SAM methylthiotransferase [Deltaproteobacteria bacterium]